MKRFINLLIVTIICLFCLIVTPKQAKAGDSRFTVTFAGVTVIGGVYILISWSVSDSFEQRLYRPARSALFNYDSKHWLLGIPELKLIELKDSGITPYVDLIKFHF